MNVQRSRSTWSPVRVATILAIIMVGMARLATPTANARINGHGVNASRQQSPTASSDKTVWFVARGPDGKLVTGLTKQDLQVFEDGKLRQITSFLGPQNVSTPLTVGLLLQFSGQRHDTLPYGELDPAAGFFRSAISGRSEGFVATFAARIHPLGNFTSDPAELERDVSRAKGDDLRGSSSLYDAIFWACEERMSTGYGMRNALVIVGDGHDNSSRHTLKNAIQAALRSGTQIYFLDIADANPYITPARRGELNGEVEKLVGAAGGSLIFVDQNNQFEEAFKLVAEQLSHEYAVGFHLTGKACDSNFHRITIRTVKSGFRVFGPRQIYASENCAAISRP